MTTRAMVPNLVVPANAQIGPAIAGAAGAGSRAGRENLFDEAILSKGSLGRRSAEWVISLWVHVAVVAVLVIVPLFYTQVIDLRKFEVTYLAAPPTLAAPPPPPPAAALAPQPEHKVLPTSAKLTMPIAIPKKVLAPATAPEPDLIAGVPGGIPGGIPGGQLGGALGGFLGEAAPAAPAPPPAESALAAPSGPLRIGGKVKRPQELYTPAPRYPILAKQSKIQGVVEIDAVIDKDGNVVEARVMDGPKLLIAAALDAVKQWKYEPTYLNGEPWSVELTIHVTFALS